MTSSVGDVNKGRRQSFHCRQKLMRIHMNSFQALGQTYWKSNC